MSHQSISFIKSAIRLLGYFLLVFDMTFACFVLVLSEVIGIYEEVGEK